MQEQPTDSQWLFSTDSATYGNQHQEQPRWWHSSSKVLSTLYFCTQLIIPCLNATGRWLLNQEVHRNICCHMEEIVFTGTNLWVYKASQLYYITVYKASPLEGKQEKGKAKKCGKVFLLSFWYKNSSGWEGRLFFLSRRDNKALWTCCWVLFPKQELCFVTKKHWAGISYLGNLTWLRAYTPLKDHIKCNKEKVKCNCTKQNALISSSVFATRQ